MSSRPYKFTGAANTTPLYVGDEARLTGFDIINTNAALRYLKVFWAPAGGFSSGGDAPTVGTDVPAYTIPCVPTTAATPPNRALISSSLFKKGKLWVAVTTGAADSDNTAAAAGDIIATLFVE
jgi:hypothetical protein